MRPAHLITLHLFAANLWRTPLHYISCKTTVFKVKISQREKQTNKHAAGTQTPKLPCYIIGCTFLQQSRSESLRDRDLVTEWLTQSVAPWMSESLRDRDSVTQSPCCQWQLSSNRIIAFSKKCLTHLLSALRRKLRNLSLNNYFKITSSFKCNQIIFAGLGYLFCH